jgi:hypothetical protein
MDPYIEDRQIWSDFHGDLAGEIRARLNARIRPNYYAALTPYVTYEVIEIAQTKRQSIRPDVGVMMNETRQQYATVAAIDPPQAESTTQLEIPLELLSIEIHQVGTDALVTAIEILSPVNKQKSHDARTDYLRKRRELLRSQAHFMEIDLLRGGERTPLDEPVPYAPYYASLSRVQSRPRVFVWTIQIDARLPRVPVPLAEPDPDVVLDLGEVVASVYERGGYDTRIDYRQPVPPPALSESEAAFVSRLLQPLRA